MNAPARVISAHGRTAWVLSPSESTSPEESASPPDSPTSQARACQLKGRDLSPVANDFVRLDTQTDPPAIVDILPRSNQLMRQEAGRTKVIAANLDLVLIVVSGHPGFSPEIVTRVIASLLADGIPFLIVANKADLESARGKTADLLERVQPVAPALPWPVVHTSCKASDGLVSLGAALAKMNLGADPCIGLAGQSGMGKSSLLNRLVPEADALTQTISEALHSGRHTTTASRVYRWSPKAHWPEHGIPTTAWLIDTPGFQQFGIGHLSREDLEAAFPDWSALATAAGQSCRFADCRHDQEPGCVVRTALEKEAAGGLLEARRKIWLDLLARQASQLPR